MNALSSTIKNNLLPTFILIRPHHWVKNVFVAAPLFFAGEIFTPQLLLFILIGVICFCAVSSAIYVFNDFCDQDTDRHHPEKKLRPLASGSVSDNYAIALMIFLFLLGIALSILISKKFFLIVLLYTVINICYSLYLKNIPIIDIMIITFGFILRIEAGAAVINVAPSVWILTASGLLAVFLALAKRRDDIQKGVYVEHRKSLAGYSIQFLDTAISMTLGSLLICYIIYTTDKLIIERLGSDRLYLTIPFVFAGIMRYLQIIFVEKRSGSPTKIILNDKFMIVTVLSWLISFCLIVYI
jgi:4-hydroxybenzoate polyprenyltransferase